jgi:hypothetical protein
MVDVYSVVDRLGCDMSAMPNAVRRREDDASCSGVLTSSCFNFPEKNCRIFFLDFLVGFSCTSTVAPYMFGDNLT